MENQESSSSPSLQGAELIHKTQTFCLLRHGGQFELFRFQDRASALMNEKISELIASDLRYIQAASPDKAAYDTLFETMCQHYSPVLVRPSLS